MSFVCKFRVAAAAAITLALAATVAHADPVGVDGTIGAEWTGVIPHYVPHSDTAPENNFSGPVNATDSNAYNIYVRDDGTYYYVGLKTDSAASLPFSNLYLGNPVKGAFIGFEVGATSVTDAFVPGGSNYPLSADSNGIVVSSNFGPGGADDTIEIAIPNTFFTNNPLNIPNLASNVAAYANILQVRDSQSFGYTYSGDTDPADAAIRYGFADVTTITPEPASLGLLGAGALALIARRRRSA